MRGALPPALKPSVLRSGLPGRHHCPGRPWVRALPTDLRRGQRVVGRARRAGRSKHDLSLGATLPSVVWRGGPKAPRPCWSRLAARRDEPPTPLAIVLDFTSPLRKQTGTSSTTLSATEHLMRSRKCCNTDTTSPHQA